MELLIEDKLGALFLTAAEIPMEWLGQEMRQDFPFDVDDFLRRVRGSAQFANPGLVEGGALGHERQGNQTGKRWLDLERVVGAVGFEPTTSTV